MILKRIVRRVTIIITRSRHGNHTDKYLVHNHPEGDDEDKADNIATVLR